MGCYTRKNIKGCLFIIILEGSISFLYTLLKGADEMGYIETPEVITFNQLIEKDSLSPINYKYLRLKNKNVKPLVDIVETPIKGGKEVGSKEYIRKSNKYFIRTKAFQSESFLLDLNDETAVPIRPQAFVNHNIKKGDVLILKDSNVGEVVYVEKDYPDHMLSGGIKKLDIIEDKLYVFAFIKNDFFKKQLEFLIGKGATIRHAQDKYLDCLIPFPNGESANQVKQYVSELVQAVIRKEREIKCKFQKILKLIDDELIQGEVYSSNLKTTFNDLVENSRLDAGFYSHDFKRMNHYIENYPHGSKTIHELEFELSRGQNLQISAIGKSIYSDIFKPNYYKLYLPTHITEYGTISKVLYLGNSKELKCLEKGDLVFGAEGFEKGRSIVITEEIDKVITNIHGITIKSKTHDLELSIFVKCFLDYLRFNGIIDKFAVGGNGGSLAMKYWDNIKFPMFTEDLRKNIVALYRNMQFNSKEHANNETLNISTFGRIDKYITEKSGIIELDHQIKQLRTKIDEIIEAICLDEEVAISFDMDYLIK